MASESDRSEQADPRTGTTASADENQAESVPAPICWVCQQPIERESTQRVRGELVHADCSASLRCVVTLNPDGRTAKPEREPSGPHTG